MNSNNITTTTTTLQSSSLIDSNIISINHDDYSTTTTTTSKQDCYYNNVKWSPDGCCLLSSRENKSVQLFELTQEESKLKLIKNIQYHDIVYDMSWYPHMNSGNPETCYFAVSGKHQSIGLYDAFVGNKLCGYTPWTDVDDIESAISIDFNNNADKLYSLCDKSIKIFKVSRPGNKFETIRTYDRKANEGIPGRPSQIAFDRSNVSGFYAVSTFDGYIGLFDQSNDTMVDILPQPTNFTKPRGITQLSFSKDGYYLFAGYRKSNYIIGWDIRNTEAQQIFSFERLGDTNQRLHFDLDPTGKYLSTGSQNGLLHLFPLSTTNNNNNDNHNDMEIDKLSTLPSSTTIQDNNNETTMKNDDEIQEPKPENDNNTINQNDQPIILDSPLLLPISIQVSNQCINSVRFNPLHPTLMALTFGERNFDLPNEEDEEEEEKEEVQQKVKEESFKNSIIIINPFKKL
ncbi:hypothetical protein DFA_09519 [Cavenderia fasciculata]|uniref:WD40 repeat-containing protein n=1 Tax=Cavenderia fasciculata TaxID=261658 RepID=F4Q7V0_CACFS|nr:uncharacterized protein DFA_09519 [Cavenderia fasciculata]EGG15850.1 hypothetical protein DFA_09519 [Cavenderia fasciculata]|eukprot:XP_004352175.1 hypothetical protein DFA_09519 [Cavenderia fasciculata]